MLIKSGNFSCLFKTVGGKFTQNPHPLGTPIRSEKSTLVQLRKSQKISQPWHNGSEGVEHARGPEFNSRAFFNRIACKKLFFQGVILVLGIVEKFIFREKNGWAPNFFSKNWGYPPITKIFSGARPGRSMNLFQQLGHQPRS